MMGRGYTEYTSPTTGHTLWVVYSAFLEYRLSDGSKLLVDQQPAWCRGCRDLLLAERIASIEELEQLIADLQMRQGPIIEHWEFLFLEEKTDENIEREIAEHRKRISWRRNRRSAPRCLTCGSVEIDPVSLDGEFVHPETGERFIAGGWGFASCDPWIAVFSPEGEALPEEENE